MKKIFGNAFLLWSLLAAVAVALFPLTGFAETAATGGFDLMNALPLLGLAGTITASTQNPSAYGSGTYPQRGGATRTFIPQVWSGKLTEKFYTATVFGEIANTDWDGEIKNQGDEVIIHNLPDVTIVDYEKGQTIAYEDLDAENTSLTVDYAKMFAFKLDDIDRIQASRKLMDDWAGDAGEQMKIKTDYTVLNTVYTSVDADNQGATAGRISGGFDLGGITGLSITKDNILDLIVDLGTVLDEADVPDTGRWLVLPAKLCGMIKKSDLKDASITGDGESILRNGRLGIIDRFVLYKSNQCPLVAETTTNWKIMCGTKHAITFASQITEVQHFDKLETTFGQAMRGLNVFGFDVIKGDAMALASVAAA
jgi:hypothetical protein